MQITETQCSTELQPLTRNCPSRKKEHFVFPRSKRDIVREEGQHIQPLHFDATNLANQRVILGLYQYAGQYQQRPQAAEGGIFKRTYSGSIGPSPNGRNRSSTSSRCGTRRSAKARRTPTPCA